jgi:hypothetical protein
MAKARGAKGGKTNARPLVIKKEEIIGGVHHGGAWKVAYADFVTALMAFFLLMWLINATTVAQRIGLADYFSQANILNCGASGEGKPFGGSDPFDTGALASNLGTIQVMPGKHQPQSIHPPLPRRCRIPNSFSRNRVRSARCPAMKCGLRTGICSTMPCSRPTRRPRKPPSAMPRRKCAV